MTTTLSPMQQREMERCLYGIDIGNLFVVYGNAGMGKTTVLQAIQQHTSATFLAMRDFVALMRGQNPLAMEETFAQMMQDALAGADVVILDDLHLLYDVVCGCGFDMYPRSKFLNAPLTTLAAQVAGTRQKLIFGMQGNAPAPISSRAYGCSPHKPPTPTSSPPSPE